MSDYKYDEWIGVDFDGVLAEYHSGDFAKYGPLHFGDPIPRMVERVQEWLSQGIEVRIFTARAFEASAEETRLLQDWCKTHIGQVLPITCTKDFRMICLWDDRAIQVVPNTGERADECPRCTKTVNSFLNSILPKKDK